MIHPSAQIVLRDLPDGRLEVAVSATRNGSTSAAVARHLVIALGELCDVRGVAAGLAEGKLLATDTVMLLGVGEAVTLDERAAGLDLGPAAGSA